MSAGVPLLSLKIIEDGSDCTVEAMFKYGARHWGVRYADISMDAPRTALWDILRQIQELRQEGGSYVGKHLAGRQAHRI